MSHPGFDGDFRAGGHVRQVERDEPRLGELPVLALQGSPERDSHCDPTTRRAPAGAGEEPISALFPAIANAFFDATGVRLRQVPMTPAVVRNALARRR